MSPASQQAVPNTPQTELDQNARPKPTDLRVENPEKRVVVVEEPREIVKGNLLGLSDARSSNIFRCVNVGVGCIDGDPSGLGGLVSSRHSQSHKCARIKSNRFSSPTLAADPQGEDSSGGGGQLHSLSISKKRGGGTRSLDLNRLAREVLLWAETHHIVIQTCFVPGHLMRTGGCTRQKEENNCNERVVTSSTSLQTDLRVMGNPIVDLIATHRLDAYVSPIADPQSWKTGSLSVNWSFLFGYAFSPLLLRASSHRNTQGVQSDENNFSHSMVANAEVVHGGPGAVF